MPTRCLEAGRWAAVAAQPKLPDVEQCPPILSRYSWIGTPSERAVECCTGHRQKAVREHHFVPCDAPTPPTIADVLAALRGRTVAMVGDSTMHQLWTALVAEIFATGRPVDVTQRVLEFDLQPQNHNKDDMCTVSHTNTPRIGGCENTFRLHARSRPMCNLTRHQGGKGADFKWQLRPMCESIPDLELRVPAADVTFLFYRMDANRTRGVRAAWQRTHGHCGTAKKNFADKLDAAGRNADALVANIGVWYGHEEKGAYRADVAHVLARLQAFTAAGKLAMYRESVVQHFPTASGSGLYEERTDGGPAAKRGGLRGAVARSTCPTQCAALGDRFANQLDWRNRVLHELVARTGFAAERVLPVAALLRPMAHLHKNTKWHCTLDCTHYCYHPAVWSALLDSFYRRLINHFEPLPAVTARQSPPPPGVSPAGTAAPADSQRLVWDGVGFVPSGTRERPWGGVTYGGRVRNG